MGGKKDALSGVGDSGTVTITLSTSDAQNLVAALTQGLHAGGGGGKGTMTGGAKGDLAGGHKAK